MGNDKAVQGNAVVAGGIAEVRKGWDGFEFRNKIWIRFCDAKMRSQEEKQDEKFFHGFSIESPVKNGDAPLRAET